MLRARAADDFEAIREAREKIRALERGVVDIVRRFQPQSSGGVYRYYAVSARGRETMDGKDADWWSGDHDKTYRDKCPDIAIADGPDLPETENAWQAWVPEGRSYGVVE